MTYLRKFFASSCINKEMTIVVDITLSRKQTEMNNTATSS